MTKVDSTVLTWRTVESDVESVRSFTKNNLSGQDIFSLKSSGYGPIQQKNPHHILDQIPEPKNSYHGPNQKNLDGKSGPQKGLFPRRVDDPP